MGWRSEGVCVFVSRRGVGGWGATRPMRVCCVCCTAHSTVVRVLLYCCTAVWAQVHGVFAAPGAAVGVMWAGGSSWGPADTTGCTGEHSQCVPVGGSPRGYWGCKGAICCVAHSSCQEESLVRQTALTSHVVITSHNLCVQDAAQGGQHRSALLCVCVSLHRCFLRVIF